jgi:UPF0716 protein FxsA
MILVRLVIFFTLFPLLELFILIKLIQATSWVFTVCLVLGTGLVGATMAKIQGLATWRRIGWNLRQGIVPADELLNGLLIFLGGVLLITPGLITDCIGFCTLIPITRGLMREWIKVRFTKAVQSGHTTLFFHHIERGE